MRAVLFDLGNTLVDADDRPLPGAVELLTAMADLRDGDGAMVPIGLVSDYYAPTPEIGVEARKKEYYQRLRGSGLGRFFEPLEQHVTLSTEVGFEKPDARIFRAALDRIQPGAVFSDAVFVTEEPDHVREARRLDITAIHFKGPGQSTGEVDQLTDLIAILRRLVTRA